MIEFALAVFFLLITPGPGVLSTAGIGAAYGYRAGFAYLGGLMLGGGVTMLLVITGLAAIMLAVPWLRFVLLLASVGYLTYLAWRIASAGTRIGFTAATKPLGFRNGFLLQFINPKAYVVPTTLFSGFAFLPQSPVWEVIIKVIIFNAIWVPVHLIWLAAGAKLGSLDLSHRMQRTINIGMAGAMLAVVAIALLANR
ncbi:LysE family translocator [Sulfitobacter geojensis]|uniref:LysE family translocator n=1 Tax=Sulfitobacter geojensis TaxID=1342299 RepID=UPI00046979C8|nr:LysE family translocator [Sulfitobacter geojensis]KHA50468.1 Transporter, LysE family [Sulfitobacter geojensis]NYI27144.1 threonine/homoserine/homoserine lactone efflux protein [Sulfitobacter geojensis]